MSVVDKPPPSSPTIPLSLAGILENFAVAWQQGKQPAIEEHLLTFERGRRHDANSVWESPRKVK